MSKIDREKANKRREKVVGLRNDGFTFSAIAKKLGVSVTTASQIYRKALSEVERINNSHPVVRQILTLEEETKEAKTRAANIFQGLLEKKTEDQIANDGIIKILKTRNAGWRTALIIYKAMVKQGYNPPVDPT